MIKFSSEHPKRCAKCKQPIYTFEMRKNINKSRVEHLQCKNSD